MSSTAVPFVAAMSSAIPELFAPPIAMAASSVGVKMPTPYVAMSIRNQGAAVKIVRRRMSRLNSAGWNSDLMPSGARSGVLWSFSKRIRRHRSIVW